MQIVYFTNKMIKAIIIIRIEATFSKPEATTEINTFINEI